MYWGDTYAEKAMMRMSGKIKEIYAEAAQDIDKKIQEYNQRFLKKDAEYRKKVSAGTMTKAEYDSWKQGQVFTGKRWKSVRDDIEHQINAANHTATDIVNGERQAVFVQNVNYAQYTIDKDFQFGLSFNLYDSATVTRLIRDDPDMLPAVGQDERKTDEWTRKLVSSAITQGVIQGESIPKISKRIAEKLGSSNEKSMTRIARTAMTSAQNAGRIEAMHNAQDMGIEVKKLWISTLDNRTRDAHRDLDGQTQLVDDPFKSRLGDIMFPGDPNATPANVWHCRCALGWEYPEYKNNYVHKSAVDDDAETGEYLSYREWEKRKRGEAEPEPIPLGKSAAERNEIIDRVKSALREVPDMYRDIIYNSLDNADDKMLDIVDKTIGNANFDWSEYDPHGCSYYSEGTGMLTILTKDSSGEDREASDILRTFWHEYGHFVDDSGVSKSGYGKKWDDGYFANGIRAVVQDEHRWEKAAVEDVNQLLQKMGLGDKYKCAYNDGMYSAAIFKNGEYINPRAMDFETTNDLSNCLTKWVHEFSGDIGMDEYMVKNYGYPERPDRTKYVESYFTPKRNLYRERELFKGAKDAYQKETEKYYEAVDKFNASHNVDAIKEEWYKLAKEAEKREKSVAAATDTFDGGVMGSFSAFILWGGHTPEYLSRNTMGCAEGIANVFSNQINGNEYEREAMMSLCPNIYNLINGAIRND